MSKRLIILLALAFVVGLTCSAYAEVQNVKISGDITALGIARNMTLRDGKAPVLTGTPADERHSGWDRSLASIARVRIDADLTDNVMATVRLLNERYWGGENASENDATSGVNSDISLDLAYVTMKEFLYSPLTVIVGRQELHFGNEMIVGDPDTNNVVDAASPFSVTNGNRRDPDLSARKAFDAIRLTLNYDPLVVDLIAAKVKELVLNLNDDEDLYGVNLNYALNKKTTLEGYWFQKRTGHKPDAGATTAQTATMSNRSKADTINTIGARVASTPIQDLMVSLEGAIQFGRYYPADGTDSSPMASREAWAAEGAVGYTFSKVKYTPNLMLLAAFFSGDSYHFDEEASGTYRAWNPMYENQKYGDIANALFNQSNALILGATASAKPLDDVTLSGEYYYFWWDKPYKEGDRIASARDAQANLLMTTRKNAGQEFDLKATYDYTEDVQLGLLYGILFPGAAFDKANRNAASELIGSMKVTF